MSAVKERVVARARGCSPTHDLAEAAADFYLLEVLSAGGDEKAAKELGRLEKRLAEEFSAYLDMAVGGELRYAKRHLPEDSLPPELACYFREVVPAQRGRAWLVWTVVRRALGPRALDLAGELFSRRDWPRNFGGWAWAQAVRHLRRYLEGEIGPRIFVDGCFSIEHNCGLLLNKLYDTRKLSRVLVAQGASDCHTLLSYASDSVKRRWRIREWEKRKDHDPIWLGVQVLDTYEELVGGGIDDGR